MKERTGISRRKFLLSASLGAGAVAVGCVHPGMNIYKKSSDRVHAETNIVTMHIIKQFDASKEMEFMELEKKFAELEYKCPDYPKGKRLHPISAGNNCNTLIWECEFPNMANAYKVLDFFSCDGDHQLLLTEQLPFLSFVKIEFYKNLDY
jgi:hypothetical protein